MTYNAESLNHPYPASKSNGLPLRNGFDTLVNDTHQQNGWRAFIMRWFSRPKFCFSRLKIHRYKTNLKKKLKLMLGFLFVDQRNSSEFRYEIVFRGIQPCFFTAGRLACFKPNQGSDVFEETSRVHSVPCGQGK